MHYLGTLPHPDHSLLNGAQVLCAESSPILAPPNSHIGRNDKEPFLAHYIHNFIDPPGQPHWPKLSGLACLYLVPPCTHHTMPGKREEHVYLPTECFIGVAVELSGNTDVVECSSTLSTRISFLTVFYFLSNSFNLHVDLVRAISIDVKKNQMLYSQKVQFQLILCAGQ